MGLGLGGFGIGSWDSVPDQGRGWGLVGVMVRAWLCAREVEVHIEGVLLHGHVEQVLQVHAHLDVGLVRGRLLGVEQRAAVTNLTHRQGERLGKSAHDEALSRQQAHEQVRYSHGVALLLLERVTTLRKRSKNQRL